VVNRWLKMDAGNKVVENRVVEAEADLMNSGKLKKRQGQVADGTEPFLSS